MKKILSKVISKKTFKLLIANTFIFLICFGVLELFLRIFFPIYTVGILEMYHYEEKTAYRLKKNIHLFKTLDYQAEIFTNSHGTVNFQDNFDDYEKTVYTVGDSFTEGSGLPSDASYPFQLNLLLNFDGYVYQKKYGVVNLGVGGFSGKQNILRLKQYIEDSGKPDIILYMGSENDEEEDFLFDSGMRHNQLIDGNPRWGLMVKPIRWFTNELQVGLRLKLAIRKIRMKLNKIKSTAHAEMSGKKTLDNQSHKQPSVAELQRPNFEELLSLSKENNVPLIVSWSNMWSDLDSYDWLKYWSYTNNVSFADWRPLVQSVNEAIPSIPVLNNHQGGHYRTWINKMIAHAYAHKIGKLEALSPEQSD